MLRIGNRIGRIKVKRSKVKVARANEYCAQKRQMYAENVTSKDSVYIHVSYRKSMSPEQMAV